MRARTAARLCLAPQITENLALDGPLSRKFGAINSEPGVGSSFQCPRRWCVNQIEADSSELQTAGPLLLWRTEIRSGSVLGRVQMS